jgi:hypothetical protein
MTDEHLPFEREATFPQLRRGEYRKTSCEDTHYNCIDHAAGKDDNWWWPPVDGEMEGVHWPAGVAPVETVEAFILAYETEGYEICPTQSRELEAGFEKIAIYIDVDGTPTHAARQLPDGSWTSKLGDWEDIQHQTLEALETGDDEAHQELGYGKVAKIMRRRR